MKKETQNGILAIGATLILAFILEEIEDRVNAKRAISSLHQNLEWSRRTDPRFKYLREGLGTKTEIDRYFLKRP